MDKLINYEDLGSFHENLVNDAVISEKTTWSSEKISSELINKANISDVSTTLISKQDVLTAGTNINISNNTISAIGYKYNSTKGWFIEGNCNALGEHSHAEGNNTQATGNNSHAEGYETNASISNSHAEGASTHARGYGAHAEGTSTKAYGDASHAEGASTQANGKNSHAEGASTHATGEHSHAEGASTTASGLGAHAEGYNTTASGEYSHAEGYFTTASYYYAHTEGGNTVASGNMSHAEGNSTLATNMAEHAEGSYNVSHKFNDTLGYLSDPGNTIHSTGIGAGNNSRKNALEVMQNGDTYLYGVGGYDGVHIKNEDPNINVQTLQEYILSLEARIYALEHPTTTE